MGANASEFQKNASEISGNFKNTGIYPAIKGYKIKEVPVVWSNRKAGKSSFRVFKVAIPYVRVGLRAFSAKHLKK